MSVASNSVDQAKSIQANLEGAKEKLENALEGIADANAKLAVLEALRKIDLSISTSKDLVTSLSGTENLDSVIEEARYVQKILAGLLGKKEFHGYTLKQKPVEIDIEIDGRYDRVLRERLSKLGIRIGGSGRVSIGRDEIVSKFNSLRAEFYGLLVEAAAINPAYTRIHGLANWGRDTKVIYQNETFGEQIVSTTQVWDLNLR